MIDSSTGDNTNVESSAAVKIGVNKTIMMTEMTIAVFVVTVPVTTR